MSEAPAKGCQPACKNQNSKAEAEIEDSGKFVEQKAGREAK
jgi:hypothetical protein